MVRKAPWARFTTPIILKIMRSPTDTVKKTLAVVTTFKACSSIMVYLLCSLLEGGQPQIHGWPEWRAEPTLASQKAVRDRTASEGAVPRATPQPCRFRWQSPGQYRLASLHADPS